MNAIANNRVHWRALLTMLAAAANARPDVNAAGACVPPPGLVSAAGQDAAAPENTVVPYTVRLSLPAPGYEDPKAYTIEQLRDAAGLPVGYRTDVVSVICIDQKCQLVTVRMFWDVVGRYQRYELPRGTTLTKKDHIPFTEADYAQLHRLLRNRDSQLRDVAYARLAAPTNAPGVDAVTSATTASLRKEVVDGAGYTCYTLWHWANGGIVEAIRKLTAEVFESRLALRLLASGEEDAVRFALRQLEPRGLGGDELVAAVKRAVEEPGGSANRLVPALDFLTRAMSDHPDERDRYFAKRFLDADYGGRQVILDYLEAHRDIPSDAFFEAVTDKLPELNEYYVLHRLLTLITRNGYRSARLDARVAELLKNGNFFIARRALRFLEQQPLSPELLAAVKAFRQQYADRL